jgi:hypothetical protein
MNPMRPYGVTAMCAAVWFAVFSMSMAVGLCAQEAAAPRHTGVPQDWSQGHIVFSRDALARHPELIYRERRILYQAMQRWRAPNSTVPYGADSVPASVSDSSQRDWNLPLGAKVVGHMYPAKFSFDPAAKPDCLNDFVVFGTVGIGTPGASGGHANLVALNNLYVNSAGNGFCTGLTAPTVLFAYNITTVTGGRISTSPVLSEDGTKIAFVESVPGGSPQAIFHVLTWTPNQGAINSAAVPGPGKMTSLNFSPTSNCTSSSPWIDYATDIVYVGSDRGDVYKITPVFKGTPVSVGGNWPVTVHAKFHITPPVLDAGRSVLMVGSSDGVLYKIDTKTGVLALSSLRVGKNGGTSSGIVAPPIVDGAAGTTFVVSANDGTSAVLVEADTASMGQLAKVGIGVGSSKGTVLNLYDPALSNDYFNDPSTGVIRLCGTGTGTDTSPWQYAFGFTVPVTQPILKASPSFSQQLRPSLNARCTGWTEFFNPNIGGGTDFFFFGLTQDCTGTGPTGGCVAETTGNTGITAMTINGGPSGIIVDNFASPTTYPEASSIYLSSENVGTAYKFTQNGLQ